MTTETSSVWSFGSVKVRALPSRLRQHSAGEIHPGGGGMQTRTHAQSEPPISVASLNGNVRAQSIEATQFSQDTGAIPVGLSLLATIVVGSESPSSNSRTLARQNSRGFSNVVGAVNTGPVAVRHKERVRGDGYSPRARLLRGTPRGGGLAHNQNKRGSTPRLATTQGCILPNEYRAREPR